MAVVCTVRWPLPFGESVLSYHHNDLILKTSDYIARGKIAWFNSRGAILAVTELYDYDDPTDRDVIITVPAEPFIAGFYINSQDEYLIKQAFATDEA